MNNPYCASFEHVRALYIDHQWRSSRARYEVWQKIFSREKIKQQLDTQKGEIIDDIRNVIRSATKKTELVEFIAALQLADFYFPNEEKEICFEIRRGVNPLGIDSYEKLIDSFEDNTHIDCAVRASDKKIEFQIKRDYSDHTPSGFTKWLNEKALLNRYGEMNGTSLVIFLGVPTDGSIIEIDKFYEEFTKDAAKNVTFDEVALLYNDGTSGHIVLHNFFPENKRILIPTDLAMARLRGAT